jgi:1-acyl-sn-glycerol-3-phosphate acyltransferase
MAAGSKRSKRAKPRRPRRPALGNDPFVRGAAPREPAARAARSTRTTISAPTSTPTPTPTATPTPTPTPSRAVPIAAAAAARLEDVERRVDSALDGVEARLQELAARAGIGAAPRELGQVVSRLWPAVRGRLAGALDLLRLLEAPRRLDPFGMDPQFAERLEAVVDLFYVVWWRVAVTDVAHVPTEGPAVVVANHAGAVPWDAFVLRRALRREHPAHRELRPLLDDRECALPLVGAAAVRYGAVRASADAAARLLAAGQAIAVFPEGSAAARKPWRERYRLLRFGRGGFAKVALRAGAPVIPCAIVGSEEASPGIARRGWLAERLGAPLLSANPSLRIASAAALPLPSRWTLRFGPAIPTRDLGSGAADDPAAVNALAERVRARVQEMLDEGVAARSSVFL